MIIPFVFKSAKLTFKAAGFIATRTSNLSPGVWISWLLNCNWNELTPANVPWGALISAGKSGSVAISFPNKAELVVNWLPVSCIPSPESPANLMVIKSTSLEFISLFAIIKLYNYLDIIIYPYSFK